MKVHLLALLLFPLGPLAAQSNEDSLKQVIAKGNDTSKVLSMVRLSAITKNKDTAELIIDRALALSKKIEFKRGEAAALLQAGNAAKERSNYPRSVNFMLKSLQIYESVNDKKGMGMVSQNLANIYLALSEYKLALDYLRKTSSFFQSINHEFRAVYFGMGRAFEGLNQLDSALAYYQRAYEYIASSGKKRSLSFILCHLGNIHAKLNNLDLAVTYTKMGVDAVDKYKDSPALASVYFHMAEIFQKSGNMDSSKFYAEASHNISITQDNAELTIESGLLLSDLYKGDDKKAYAYYRRAMTLKDSVFSRDKTNQVQNLNFNEQTRQAEVAADKLNKEHERKRTIQFTLIGVGLISLIILFFLLSRSIIVNDKLIRIIGVIGLLLVFEFINLLIHPYLANVTHHSPILMLLGMVAIAAILVPIHHKMEKWIRNKLVEKNKSIRLQAAKKIISQLESSPSISGATPINPAT